MKAKEVYENEHFFEQVKDTISFWDCNLYYLVKSQRKFTKKKKKFTSDRSKIIPKKKNLPNF